MQTSSDLNPIYTKCISNVRSMETLRGGHAAIQSIATYRNIDVRYDDHCYSKPFAANKNSKTYYDINHLRRIISGLQDNELI